MSKGKWIAVVIVILGLVTAFLLFWPAFEPFHSPAPEIQGDYGVGGE